MTIYTKKTFEKLHANPQKENWKRRGRFMYRKKCVFGVFSAHHHRWIPLHRLSLSNDYAKISMIGKMNREKQIAWLIGRDHP